MQALRSLLRSAVPLLLAGLLLTGCPVQSLHPLFDAGATPLPLDPALAGTWQADKGFDDKPASLVIAEESNHYTVKYTEGGKSTELRGVLVQAGQQRYLDLWIGSLDQFDVPLPAVVHLLPTHSFWTVGVDRDKLTCAYLHYEKAFKEQRATLTHTEIEDAPIVTASPAELREFLAKHAADHPAFFSEPLAFHRQK